MMPFCGRCGQVFTYMDLTLVQCGKVRRHFVFCKGWGREWGELRRMFLPLILILTLAGCASVKHVHYTLSPKPNTCQVTETRPSWFSIIVTANCWDGSGKALGMASTGGTPSVSVPLAILGAGATVAGAAILAGGIVGASRNLSDTQHTINATVGVDERTVQQVQGGGP